MKRYHILKIMLSALILLASATLPAQAQEKETKKVLVIAPTFNIQGAGISIEGIQKIGDTLIKKIEKRTGLTFEYEMVGTQNTDQDEAMDLALERLKTGGDVSWMDYKHYLMARDQGIDLGIIALIEVEGSLSFTNCLYVLKDAPLKNMEDLRGKRVNGGPNLDWVGLRTIMYKYDVDERPDKFFSELLPISSMFSQFNGVLNNRLDAFVLPEPVFNVLRNTKPSYAAIAPMLCADGSYSTVLPVYRKGIDDRVVDTFRSLLLNVQTDPDLGVVRPFLEAAKIRFVEPRDSMLENIDKSYKLAESRGWFKEADEYLDIYKAIAIKKLIGKCIKKCTKSTPELVKECISECEDKYENKK